MALNGLHIAFSYAGGRGNNKDTVDIMNGIESSQTVLTGQVSTIGAPSQSADKGDPVLIARPSTNGWLAIGKSATSASADADPRMYLRADEPPLTMYVKPGTKVAWKADV